MPVKQFLEEYPLYRRMKMQYIPVTLDKIHKVSINMTCDVCKSSQTFTMKNEYYDEFIYANHPTKGAAVKLAYLCSHCNHFQRLFFVKFSENDSDKWIMKVGQFPAWEIAADKKIENILSSHSTYYTNGRFCESQGYGIGAFIYYLRVLQNTVDDILSEKGGQETPKSLKTEDKINYIKDFLPSTLCVNGINPLSALYSILTEGIQSQSDEECLEFTQSCRETLTFLISHVATDKETSSSFTNNLQKLLDKIAANAEYELNIMSVNNAADIIEEGQNLIVVANIGKELHIRVFDYTGKRIFDKPENEMINGENLMAFKEQLNDSASEFGISMDIKRKIIDQALFLASHSPAKKEPQKVTQVHKKYK